MRSSLRFLIASLVFLAAASSAPAAPARKVVIQAPADFTEAALEDLAARARARGVVVEIAAEGGAVERGFDLLRLSTLPPSDRFRDAVLVFPVKIESGGFVFDGSPYRRSDEAVRLTTSTRAEIVVLGNSVPAVLSPRGPVARRARRYRLRGDLGRGVPRGQVRASGRPAPRRSCVRPRPHRPAQRLPGGAEAPDPRRGRLGISRERGARGGAVGEGRCAIRRKAEGQGQVDGAPLSGRRDQGHPHGIRQAGGPRRRSRRASDRCRRVGAGGARSRHPGVCRRRSRPRRRLASEASGPARGGGSSPRGPVVGPGRQDVCRVRPRRGGGAVDPGCARVGGIHLPGSRRRNRRILARRRGAPRERGGRREVSRTGRRGPREEPRPLALRGRAPERQASGRAVRCRKGFCAA